MEGIVDFTPARVDEYDEGYIIIGTQGELTRIGADAELESRMVKPFPASITCSTGIDGGWLGVWVEPELRLARMARLDTDAEWIDGNTRSDLRIKPPSSIQPAQAAWVRSMDTEPTTVCRTEQGFCFALRGRGIYHLDADANEIWRAQLPAVLDGRRRGLETAISIFVSTESLSIWYDNGLVVELSLEDGSEIDRHSLRVSERVEGVFHHESQHLLALAGGGICLSDGKQILESHKTPGPVVAARHTDSGWELTGWRLDGTLHNGELSLATRPEVGVGFVGQRVLTNDGTLADFQITRS